MITKEKAPELRRRKLRIRKVLETVFGFKIWVLWDPNSRLPLAMRFATIEVGDINYAREVIEHDEQSGKSPVLIAKLIAKIINKKTPKLRYVTGAFYQKITIFLKKALPNRWFDAIIAGYYKVK